MIVLHYITQYVLQMSKVLLVHYFIAILQNYMASFLCISIL